MRKVTSTQIRRAQVGDERALHLLVREHAQYERGSASIDLQEIERLVADPKAPVVLLVADEGAGPIGFAAVTFDYAFWRGRMFAYLDCLFVTESHRGKAIGQALFDAACANARSRDADSLEWQTPIWNAGAIRFYTRQGAEKAEKMRFSRSL